MPVVFILGAIVMAVIAHYKGFNPLLWIVAGGIPGLLILLFLPSANEKGISDEIKEARSKRGNTVGGVISILAVVLIVVMLVALSNM